MNLVAIENSMQLSPVEKLDMLAAAYPELSFALNGIAISFIDQTEELDTLLSENEAMLPELETYRSNDDRTGRREAIHYARASAKHHYKCLNNLRAAISRSFGDSKWAEQYAESRKKKDRTFALEQTRAHLLMFVDRAMNAIERAPSDISSGVAA